MYKMVKHLLDYCQETWGSLRMWVHQYGRRRYVSVQRDA